MACSTYVFFEPELNDGDEAVSTILLRQGWLFYFYENRIDEPVHVYAVKGNAECKYWLNPDGFDIEEDFGLNLSPRLRREVRQLVFEHFDEIVHAWHACAQATTIPVVL